MLKDYWLYGKVWIMPRSPRIEFPGAVYHVISRGNNRDRIFVEDGDREMFLDTLRQACERAGWVVHSYAMMSNHYHLLLETPQANLVDGMQWFQTAYTARFHARHHASGHLFQGRYKAVMVSSAEPEYFRRLSDYIHLNPLRGGLLKGSRFQLEDYPWSSYPCMIGVMPCPKWLQTTRVLKSHHMTAKKYRRDMERKIKDIRREPNEYIEEWEELRRGWYLGGEDFRRDMLDRIDRKLGTVKRESYAGAAMIAHNEQEASLLLVKGLAALETDVREVKALNKTDLRKQALAWLLRSSTLVSAEWICRELGMGHRSNISRAVRRLEQAGHRSEKEIRKIMLHCKD